MLGQAREAQVSAWARVPGDVDWSASDMSWSMTTTPTMTAIVMPGSFTIDSPLNPKLDINVGAKSHIFQPPKSQSASGSLHLSRASLANYDDRSSSAVKRKLSQRDFQSSDMDLAMSISSDTWSELPCESPAPFVNTQYRLAGGLETPVHHRGLQASQPHPSSGGRWLRPIDAPEADGYFPDDHIAPALARERNGHARVPTSPISKAGFGKAVYTVAGVAGRVWEFCRLSTFRGFFAGGGQGYEMHAPQRYADGERSVWEELGEKDSRLCWVDCDDHGASTPVPGRFPDEDFIADYMSLDHCSTTSPAERAPKRVQRHKSSTSEEMSASWMVVSRSNIGATPAASRESSPVNRKTQPSASSASYRKQHSHARLSRPTLSGSRASTSSYYGNKHHISPSLKHRHSTSGSNGNSVGASFASVRSPTTITTEKPKSIQTNDSPLSAELQRHAARLRRREIEEDANLQRLNRQLKAMIREGKEALGSKVEVDFFDDG